MSAEPVAPDFGLSFWQRVFTLVAAVEYKPGWHFAILPRESEHEGLFVRLVFTDGVDRQTGRRWYLSPHSTRSEIVQTLFLAVKTAEEHEMRERFRYCGQAIFGPHHDVAALADFCRHEKLDVRA